MSIGGLIVGIILLTLVGGLIAWPYVRRSAQAQNDLLATRQRDRLRVYYDRALRNIRDLDEDHALGKIPDEDYAAERELWMQRGIQAMKAWDMLTERETAGEQDARLDPLPATDVDDAAIDHAIESTIDSAIEQAVRKLRTGGAGGTALLLMLMIVLGGCTGLAGDPVIVSTLPPPTAPPTESRAPAALPVLADGAAIYAARCTDCHGVTGAGDGTLVQSGQVMNAGNFLSTSAADQTPHDWYTTITNGRIENLMPPWRDALTAAQRWNTTYYTYTMHYTADEIERGRVLYADSCAECHGETGRGDGPRAADVAANGRGVGDLTDPAAMTEISDRTMFVTVTEGVGEHMPAYADWSEADRWAVTRYTRTLGLADPALIGIPNPQIVAQLPTPDTAQTTDPEATPAADGIINGRIVSGTAEGLIPPEAEVELFVVRGTDFTVLQQSTTLADVGGAFTFSDVLADPTARYIARAFYRDRLYTSPIVPGTDFVGDTLDLTITVYELTEDPTVLRVERMVTQMTAVGESLEVLHIVSITNTSDRAYSTGQTLEDGRPISVVWSLPPGAIVSGFGENGRYAIAQDEFAIVDTLPVLPGAGHLLQVVYLLEYGGDAIVEQELNYALDGQVRVLARPLSVRVTSDQLAALGTEQVGTNEFGVYGAALQLSPGDVVGFQVSGAGVPVTAQGVPQTSVGGDALPLIVIAVIAGEVVLIGGVYLWYRRRKAKAAASQPPISGDRVLIDGLVRQIAELDAEYEAGKVTDAAYTGQRAALKARLAELMTPS